MLCGAGSCVASTFEKPDTFCEPDDKHAVNNVPMQKFAAVHSFVHNLFNLERHLYSRDNFKLNRAAVLSEWRQLGAA